MKSKLFSVVPFLMGTWGCGADVPTTLEDPTSEAERAWLVAVVEQPSGNVVEFYELSPGQIVVSEIGRGEPTIAPDELEAMTTLEIYETVSMGEPMAKPLADALTREHELFETGEVPTRTGERPNLEPFVPPPVSAIPQASALGQGAFVFDCDWDWFQATFCSFQADYEACKKDQGFGQHDVFHSARRHFTAVCSKQGTANYSIFSKMDWTFWWNVTSFPVPFGWWRSWSIQGYPWRYDIQSTVYVEAMPAQYHYVHRGGY